MNLNDMTREQLLEQADVLELDIAKNTTTSNLLKAIKAELGEADVPKSVKKTDDVQINFANDQKNKQPVFFGLNGKSYRFPRGKWVRCPRALLPTIENAKRRIQDESGEWMEVNAYPYQVKEA